MRDKQEIEKDIAEIEAAMGAPGFWDDSASAQAQVQKLQDLKDEAEGVGKFDRGDAIMTIFAGAGGDDAEDFTKMLLAMYMKYIEERGWQIRLLHENKNDQGGFRNVQIEILGKNVYGDLKGESGVHRLVRVSPFDSNKKRHTSFAMAEVIPKFEKPTEVEIDEKDLRVDLARSSGPGGQNVNKRETAVRLVHEPTGISVFVDSERSQLQNKEKALAILSAKLYNRIQEEQKAKESGMYVSKTADNEWGSQIRSYVLHPYKMVKDHRTNTEVRDVDKVLDGDIQPFIDAQKDK